MVGVLGVDIGVCLCVVVGAFAGAAGTGTGAGAHAGAVAVPTLQAVVRAAYEAHVPVVPRGAGSGLEGGAIPYQGGVVLDLMHMKQFKLFAEEMQAQVGLAWLGCLFLATLLFWRGRR